MGYSDAARKRAALARKIKSRLGVGAYEAFKRTGVVPSGLDAAKPGSGKKKAPSRAAKRAAAKPRLNKKKLPTVPPETAAKLPPLSDPSFMRSMQGRAKKPNQAELTALALAQAQHALPDAAVVQHYKDTGVFKRRGLSNKDVKALRDDWHEGTAIPLWAVPVGTDVAVYREEKADTPMIIGKVVGFQERHPLEESGKPMAVSVPYVMVQDQDGKYYEYPALLGGGSKSPHAKHPSFAAIVPVLRHLEYVPQTGWEFPNFYKGENAGPTGAPDDLEKLATGMTRATNFAENRKSKSDALLEKHREATDEDQKMILLVEANIADMTERMNDPKKLAADNRKLGLPPGDKSISRRAIREEKEHLAELKRKKGK